MQYTKLLSNEDVKKLLKSELVIETVEKTWAEYAKGRVVNPPKLTLDLGESRAWPPYNAFMNAMPAYVEWLDVAGLKWGGGFWNNQGTSRPSVTAMILLIEPKTGFFKCVMDGTEITAQRTAAQSAVAIKYLAAKSARHVGIFGAGTQARHHIRVISDAFPNIDIRLYDPREGVAKALAAEIANTRKVQIVVTDSMEECANADVIITLTTSKNPFLKPEWVKSGCLVLCLGSYQEAFPETIKKADKVVVDHVQQAMHRGALKAMAESGGIAESDIHATMGEIITGLKPGRTSDQEIIFCALVGTGMLDIAVAERVYREANEKGIGSEFEFYKLNS